MLQSAEQKFRHIPILYVAKILHHNFLSDRTQFHERHISCQSHPSSDVSIMLHRPFHFRRMRSSRLGCYKKIQVQLFDLSPNLSHRSPKFPNSNELQTFFFCLRHHVSHHHASQWHPTSSLPASYAHSKTRPTSVTTNLELMSLSG